jgi:lysyl-tRNA synthetase class 2
MAYKDYNWMMEFTENLLEHCAVSVNGTSDATLVKTKLALKRPMLCVTMTDSIKHFTGLIFVKLKQSYLQQHAEWESK